jgi:hypothetical protein
MRRKSDRLAVLRLPHDISFMKRFFVMVCLTVSAFAAPDTALTQVQIIPPGGSQFNPPLPKPPPGPKIEVPVVPQMDAPPRQSVQTTPHPSFSDKVTTCLQEGAAGGLGPGDRDAYSRACANSR